jgi:hypothetical protein
MKLLFCGRSTLTVRDFMQSVELAAPPMRAMLNKLIFVGLMMVSITTISTITQSMTVADSGSGVGGSICGSGSISSITQTVSVTDSWGGITDLSHGGGGICGSISGGGSISSITQTVSVTQSGCGITDLSYSGGGDDSGGGITDLRYRGGGDKSGGSISLSVATVVRGGVADFRQLG